MKSLITGIPPFSSRAAFKLSLCILYPELCCSSSMPSHMPRWTWPAGLPSWPNLWPASSLWDFFGDHGLWLTPVSVTKPAPLFLFGYLGLCPWSARTLPLPVLWSPSAPDSPSLVEVAAPAASSHSFLCWFKNREACFLSLITAWQNSMENTDTRGSWNPVDGDTHTSFPMAVAVNTCIWVQAGRTQNTKDFQVKLQMIWKSHSFNVPSVLGVSQWDIKGNTEELSCVCPCVLLTPNRWQKSAWARVWEVLSRFVTVFYIHIPSSASGDAMRTWATSTEEPPARPWGDCGLFSFPSPHPRCPFYVAVVNKSQCNFRLGSLCWFAWRSGTCLWLREIPVWKNKHLNCFIPNYI